MQRKTRHYTKYSAQYLVFPATFRVILVSWKIDDFWDSAGCSVHFTITIPRRKYRYSKNSKNRNTNYQEGVSKFFDHQLCLTNTAGLISGYWNYGVQTKTAGSPPTKNKTYSVCGRGGQIVSPIRTAYAPLCWSAFFWRPRAGSETVWRVQRGLIRPT